jgi:cell division protein FtsW
MMGRWWWTVDRWLLFSLAILIGFGLLLTIGASVAVAERLGLNSFHFAERQMAFLAVALVAMFAISLASVKTIRRIAVVMFPVCLVLMALASLIGPEIKGAQRWLPLGPFTLQPSEFMKPAFIVVSAWMFAEQDRDRTFPGWKIATALYLLVATILMSQPDFGQTALVTVVWLAQFFLAGLPMIWVAVVVAVSIVAILAAYNLLPHVASRIDRFLDPSSGDTYQVDTALNAFRSGGLFGRGPGEGLVKRVLPDSHTDFIFAVAGEEFGTLVCVGLVALFAVIVVRVLLNLLKEQDYFVFLATAGLVTLFGLQAFINIGVNLALLPAKGMTLPFVSYGGSSLMAISITMGMVLALTRCNAPGARGANLARRAAW